MPIWFPLSVITIFLFLLSAKTLLLTRSDLTDLPMYNYTNAERVDQECNNNNNGTNYIAPLSNSTAAERIGWLTSKFLELEMFKSNNKTLQFEERARQFLGPHCDGQFFMTWLAPGGRFGPREFTSVESVFKSHPRACLAILSASLDSECGSRILKPLVNQGHNVVAVTPDLDFLFKDLPAQDWLDAIKTGKKDPGVIPIGQNLSNLMRLVVVYKYGGVYMDTDYIVMKDLSRLRNSIGAQSMGKSGKWSRLNNALLLFDKGHPLLYKFIKEFASTFDGNTWGYNGPSMTSRVVQMVENDPNHPGFNYTVLPAKLVYPVDWSRIPKYFEKPGNLSHSRWIEAKLRQLNSQAYGLH